MVSDNLIQI